MLDINKLQAYDIVNNYSDKECSCEIQPNEQKHLKKIRESLMMSKAELARKANISPITITRIENGMPCRMETQRKIILALGYKISDKNKVFGD